MEKLSELYNFITASAVLSAVILVVIPGHLVSRAAYISARGKTFVVVIY